MKSSVEYEPSTPDAAELRLVVPAAFGLEFSQRLCSCACRTRRPIKEYEL